MFMHMRLKIYVHFKIIMYFFYVVGQNHKDVLIVVDSEDYQAVLEYLKGGQSDQQFRRKLAWKAFQHVAAYDSAVSEWLWKQTEGSMFSFYVILLTLVMPLGSCLGMNMLKINVFLKS